MKKMTFKEALKTLMESAENDVRGSGLGFRCTKEEWREQVSEAWAIVFERVYGWKPFYNDYTNSGMRPPFKEGEPK